MDTTTAETTHQPGLSPETVREAPRRDKPPQLTELYVDSQHENDGQSAAAAAAAAARQKHRPGLLPLSGETSIDTEQLADGLQDAGSFPDGIASEIAPLGQQDHTMAYRDTAAAGSIEGTDWRSCKSAAQGSSCITSAAPATVAGDGDDPKLDLLSGKSDVYACAVRSLLYCALGTTLWTVSAMLVVCFMQLALLAMLFQAAQQNSTQLQAGDSDLLQVQTKVTQLQLCALHQAMNKSNILPAPLVGAWDNCTCLLAAATQNTSGCTADGWIADVVRYAHRHQSTLPFLAKDSDVVGLGQLDMIKTDQQKLQLLVVVLLSLGVLTVFVVGETIQAAQVSYAIAASAGILPLEFVATEHRNRCVPQFCKPWRLILACLVPILQLAVAVLAFCTAGSILALPQFLEDITQFIINSVALAFVIEIDNKAGDVLTWMFNHRWPDQRLGSIKYRHIVQCVCGEGLMSSRHRGNAHVPKSRHLPWSENLAWLSLRLPVAVTVIVLIIFAQYFTQAIYGHVVANVGPLVMGDLDQSHDHSFTHESERFVVGYKLLTTMLSVVLMVMLNDHPFLVPQRDSSGWVEKMVQQPAGLGPFGAGRYVRMSYFIAKFSWVMFLSSSLFLSSLAYLSPNSAVVLLAVALLFCAMALFPSLVLRIWAALKAAFRALTQNLSMRWLEYMYA